MLNVQFVQFLAPNHVKDVKECFVAFIFTDTQIVRRDDNGYC